jgi:hypothetical protein
MRKTIVFLIVCIISSCGIIEDTSEETFTYTFIVKNETGGRVIIKGDYPERVEELLDGQSFMCSYDKPSNIFSGICENYLFLFFPEINKGYRCHGTVSNVEGLCFEGGQGLFTRLESEGTIFTEIAPRTYEYVLTPELLEGAFELP